MTALSGLLTKLSAPFLAKGILIGSGSLVGTMLAGPLGTAVGASVGNFLCYTGYTQPSQ